MFGRRKSKCGTPRPRAAFHDEGHQQTEAGVYTYGKHARTLTSTLFKPSETGNGERSAVGAGDHTQSYVELLRAKCAPRRPCAAGRASLCCARLRRRRGLAHSSRLTCGTALPPLASRSDLTAGRGCRWQETSIYCTLSITPAIVCTRPLPPRPHARRRIPARSVSSDKCHITPSPRRCLACSSSSPASCLGPRTTFSWFVRDGHTATARHLRSHPSLPQPPPVRSRSRPRRPAPVAARHHHPRTLHRHTQSRCPPIDHQLPAKRSQHRTSAPTCDEPAANVPAMQAQGHDQWAQHLHDQHQPPLDTVRPARDLDNPSPPPFVSASVNGPVDPMEFYHPSFTPTPPPLEQQSKPSDPSMPAAMQTVSAEYFAPTTTAHRAASRSPNRNKPRSASGPAGTGAYANKALGSKTSHPVLPPSRVPGTVKDIANRFDQKALPGAVQPAPSVRTSNERYRRDIGRSKSPNSPSKTGSGGAKLQKRRPGQPKSPHKSASTSFDTSSSFGSGTLSSKSQPHAAFSPRQAKQAEQKASRPLFGEITSDGQWNGNFQLDGYGPLPKSQASMRRGSDGSIALSHGRSQPHEEGLQPLSPHANHKLHHQRSRSDLDYLQRQLPIMPTMNTSHAPILSPYGSPSTRLRKDSPTSRIPVRHTRRTGESPISAPQSRASSSLSNYSGRNKLSKSPTRMKHQTNKENEKTTPSHTRRYNPPPLTAGNNNQLLSAKIVPPPPKLSPPLRSSRPRQPVSAATTAASRARAAGDRQIGRAHV